MTTVNDILMMKGRHVVSIDEARSVLEAARLMNERGIGGVVVTKEGSMVGIFTERDILRRVVSKERDLKATSIREVMTSQVVTCRPDESVEECIRLMTAQRIRHLPVVGDEGPCGMITSSDLLALQVKDQQAMIRYLKSYAFEVGGEA